MASIYKRKTATGSKDAFGQFEEWHCGNECPIPDSFKTIKYQQYVENNFFEKAEATGYTYGPIDNSDDRTTVYGVKKGSCPKAGGKILAQFATATAENSAIKIYKGSDGIHIGSQTLTLKNLQDNYGYTGTSLPTKLGIVLVGGGAGAGGNSWYDKDKDGNHKDDTYACPGTGGGGGCTIWGVISLKTTNSSFAWYVRIGGGGMPGRNARHDDTSHDHPALGNGGSVGGTTALGIGTNEKNALDTNWGLKYSDGYYQGRVVECYGGNGGRPGAWNEIIYGGQGGSGRYVEDLYRFVYRGSAVGGNGCMTDINAETFPCSPALNFDITFMEDETGTAQTYTTKVRNPAISAYADSEYKPDASNSKIPGGNSYGNGADARAWCLSLPTKGGGGAQYSLGYGPDEPESLTYGKGADGYLALFY